MLVAPRFIGGTKDEANVFRVRQLAERNILLNSEQKDEVCDARDDDSSTGDDKIIKNKKEEIASASPRKSLWHYSDTNHR